MVADEVVRQDQSVQVGIRITLYRVPTQRIGVPEIRDIGERGPARTLRRSGLGLVVQGLPGIGEMRGQLALLLRRRWRSDRLGGFGIRGRVGRCFRGGRRLERFPALGSGGGFRRRLTRIRESVTRRPEKR
jgi:hypothetical protein